MGRRLLHMDLPHGETHRDKVYSMPDPDGLIGAYENVRERVYHPEWKLDPTREDLKRVLMLAEGYLDLTTYTLGQECCVGKLRDIWRARRARGES